MTFSPETDRVPRRGLRTGSSARLEGRVAGRLAVAALMLVLAVLTSFAIVSALRTNAAATAAARATGLNDAYSQAHYAVASEESLERKYRLEPTAAVLQRYDKAAASFLSAMRLVRNRGTSSDRALTAHLLVEQRAYRQAIRRMFAAVDTGDTSSALEIDAKEVDPRFGDIGARVAAAAAAHHTQELASVRSLEQTQRVTLIATPIAFTCGLLLVAFFSVVLVRQRRRGDAAQQARLEAQIEAAAALAASNERLRELDRLKDEFVALASHELRTPLTSICGYLELILDDPDSLSLEHARFLTVIERNATRLQRLVGDLLFVAQVDAGRLALEWERVALGDVLRESVEAIRPFASEQSVDVTLDVAEEITLVGDRARLAQVIDNLLSNAVKFTPKGGSISVCASIIGASARLEIRDSGIGIEPEDCEHLFERFFRTEEAKAKSIPGTGLGLAIAAAIITGHEGTIGVESEPGVGTTFWIELPLTADVDLPLGAGGSNAVAEHSPVGLVVDG